MKDFSDEYKEYLSSQLSSIAETDAYWNEVSGKDLSDYCDLIEELNIEDNQSNIRSYWEEAGSYITGDNILGKLNHVFENGVKADTDHSVKLHDCTNAILCLNNCISGLNEIMDRSYSSFCDGNFGFNTKLRLLTDAIDTAGNSRVIHDFDLNEDDVSRLKELGFSESEIACMIKECKNNDDKKMLKNLLQGNYVETFQIDPDNLSESATLLLASFFEKLSSQQKTDEIIDFVNGMMNQDENHVMNDGTAYGDLYLTYLSAGLQSILDNHSELIRSCGGMCDEKAFQQMAKEQQDLLRAYNLMSGFRKCFESSCMVADDLGSRSGRCRMQINSISYEDGDGMPSIQFNYIRDDGFESVIQQLDINTLETAGQVKVSDTMKKLDQLEFEKSQILTNYLYKMGLSEIKTLCPSVSGLISIMNQMADEGLQTGGLSSFNGVDACCLSYDGAKYILSQTGADTTILGDSIKINGTSLQVPGAGSIVSMLKAYNDEYKKLDKDERETIKNSYNDLFSSSGGVYNEKYDIRNSNKGDKKRNQTLTAGIYNSNVLKLIGEWEQSGAVTKEVISDQDAKKILNVDKILQKSYSFINDKSDAEHLSQCLYHFFYGGSILEMEPKDVLHCLYVFNDYDCAKPIVDSLYRASHTAFIKK